jgi:hypothetical protein
MAPSSNPTAGQYDEREFCNWNDNLLVVSAHDGEKMIISKTGGGDIHGGGKFNFDIWGKVSL